jgi:hypothetical protein
VLGGDGTLPRGSVLGGNGDLLLSLLSALLPIDVWSVVKRTRIR